MKVRTPKTDVISCFRVPRVLCAIGITLLSPSVFLNGATLNLAAFGARADANQASAGANRAAFLKALSQSSNTIEAGPGTYFVDNSTMLRIVGFSGKLVFDRDARIVLTNSGGAAGTPDKFGGFYFHEGKGATIQNMHIVWPMPAGTLRDDLVYGALKFAFTTGTVINDVTVEGSRSTGIQFYGCVGPKVNNAHISDTLADGLDFFNVQNAEASNVFTRNTGDDGIAFVRYGHTQDGSGVIGKYDNYTGGRLSNAVVTDSFARGIAVLAAQNVSVSNFLITNTTDSGVICSYDRAFNDVGQVPDQVSFAHGTIQSAGHNKPQPPSVTVSNPRRGNRFGVEIDIRPEIAPKASPKVAFDDIRIIDPFDRQFSADVGSNLSAAVLDVTNIYAYQGSNGFIFRVPNLTLKNSESNSSGDYGFYFEGGKSISVTKVFVVNASTAAHSLHRAFWVERGAASITAADVYVIDEKQHPTGVVVGGFDAKATVDVTYAIPHGNINITESRNFPSSHLHSASVQTIMLPDIRGYDRQTTQILQDAPR